MMKTIFTSNYRIYECLLWAYLSVDFGEMIAGGAYTIYDMIIFIFSMLFFAVTTIDIMMRLSLLVSRYTKHKKDGKPFKNPFTGNYDIYINGKWHSDTIDVISKLYVGQIEEGDLVIYEQNRKQLEEALEKDDRTEIFNATIPDMVTNLTRALDAEAK